ncbi:MAG: DUF1343 domain-containing protein [Candidatus Hydrogenedentota bacterium]
MQNSKYQTSFVFLFILFIYTEATPQTILPPADCYAILQKQIINVKDVYIPNKETKKITGVLPGIEVFLSEKKYYSVVKDAKLGLLTNATGVDRQLQSTIDLLRNRSDFKLIALFSPEHGIRGSLLAGTKIDSSIDSQTGLPVYSLYGKTKSPTSDMLKNIDYLIIDLQDIGSRSYTYISTMYLAMESCAKNNKGVIVLDRPNPIGGITLDGPVLEPEFKSFIGIAEIPVVHGMTIAELALYFNKECNINANLLVVPMLNWKRKMIFRDTKLPWVPPSPHIPTPESCFLYPVTGLIGEMKTLSEGVGTPMPFHLVGAPWIDGYTLTNSLPKLPGVMFRPLTVKPFYFRFVGESVNGVQIYVKPNEYKPVQTALYLLYHIKKLWPDKFQWAPEGDTLTLLQVDRAWGTDMVRKSINEGIKPEKIIESWQSKLTAFQKKRKKYLLYSN